MTKSQIKWKRSLTAAPRVVRKRVLASSSSARGGAVSGKEFAWALLFPTLLGVMPKTATAVGPQILAQAARKAREQGRGVRSHRSTRDAPVEERVAVLEARWEETVPTLATSRDISDLRGEMGELRGELRGEMRSLENRLLKWGVGAVLALLAVLAATFSATNARIDSLAARQDARMDALDAKLDARFDALMTELRAIRER